MKRLILSLFFCFSLSAEESATRFKITNHTAHLPNRNLDYVAIAGKLPLMNKDKEIDAEVFFVSYLVETGKERPITFVFPGGPGGAGTMESVIAFGPKRMLTVDEGGSILPPYTLIDNPETLLDITDLVYIDPVGCGLSQVEDEKDPLDFYGVEEDLESLSQFVHNYICAFHRWNSPKYLLGSSYGTLRCCGLVQALLKYDMHVSGIILQGCAFEWTTLWPERDHALPDCLLIPTLSATAWYHGRLWPEKPLEDVVKEARSFAFRKYALQSVCPSCLSSAEKESFFQELALFTGLPLGTIQRYNGRIDEHVYAAEFFSPERKVLGKIDSRYIGDVAAINPYEASDPSYNDTGGFAALFNHYLQTDLEYEVFPGPYISFSHEAFHSWNRHTYDSVIPNFLQRLRETLVYNPQLKILVAAGYYDCRTPFAAAEYCFDQLGLPDNYKKNVNIQYYEAGHGAIFDLPSLQKMRKDMTPFYSGTR